MSTDHSSDRGGGLYRRVTGALERHVGRRARPRLLGLYRQVHPRYRPVTVGVWGVVVVFYALGDTGLTTLVLAMGGFEMNPVARAFIETLGYPGLVVQKALAAGLLVGCWRYYPTVGEFSADPWRLVVPTIAAARGLQLVAIHVSNLIVLL